MVKGVHALGGKDVHALGRVLHQVECLGVLGLNFDYDGGRMIKNGGPIFLYKLRILEGSTSFREGIRTRLRCQTGVTKHQVIFVSQPFV